MRRKLGIFAPVLMIAVVVPACEPQEEELDPTLDTPAPAEVPAPATTPAAGERMIMFEPGPAATGAVAGQVIVRPESDGGATFDVELTGLTPGEHAWHIHSAPCGEEGPVVLAFTPTADMEGVGDPLEAGDEGRAEAEVTVPADRIPLELQAVLGGQSLTGTATPDAPTDAPAAETGQATGYSLHVHERGGVDHGATVACANLSM